MKRWPKYVTCFAVVCFTFSVSAQSPFSLDTTFRTEIGNNYVGSVLPLDDGSLIASGVMQFPGETFLKRLVKLDSDGSRDESFYNSGLGGGTIIPYDDRFYVGANTTVRRILMNGTQDSSFIGMNLGPYFSSFQGGDYHVFPDGRVVMSGSHMLSDSIRGFVGIHNFIWFTNTGYLDTTRTHRQANGAIYRFKELPDGKFICSGVMNEFEGEPVGRIFRVHADGSLDASFQTNAYWGEASAYHALDDGRVLAGGRFLINGITDTLRLTRFLPDGTVDPTFNSPSFGLGTLPDASGWGSLVSNIYPMGQGYYILQGNFREVNGQPRLGICLISENGDLVEDFFNEHGGGPTEYLGYTFANQQGIAPTPDGEYFYVWGRYHGYSDGTVNDSLQRFISRLHAGDLALADEHSPSHAERFSIYPNPAHNELQIQIGSEWNNTRYAIFDGSGRVVKESKIQSAESTLMIPIGALAAGSYLVELRSEEKVFRQQFIKR